MDLPQGATPYAQVLTLQDLQPRAFVIGDLVTITLKDGSLTYGPNYTPDAAAKKFWEAMSLEYQIMLRWKAEHPDAR